MPMKVSEHIAALRREGDLLAAAAATADLDADVPRCPDWTVRDMLRHVGGVHRWARAHLARGLTEPLPDAETDAVMAPPATDAELAGWVRDGCAALVAALDAAPPDLRCWAFLPAPSPVAFWARRQAHETGIHRADAEGAAGRVTPFEPAVAADGIDELLAGFAERRRSGVTLDVETPRTLLVDAADAGAAWLVAMGREGTKTSALDGTSRPEATCSLTGTASNLFLLLWNRAGRESVDVAGDEELLDLWRDTVHIRWT